MLEVAKQMQDYLRKRIREMLVYTLNDIRKLELVHDANEKRIFLSGKVAAYEEMQRYLELESSDK